MKKNLYFYVLWPDSSNIIRKNTLNNNALVLKLYYKKFSCIFTGDIEDIAEKELIKLYSDTNFLKSNILKVAHHGSNTSSTKDFLKLVEPNISLIGVGIENKFGHPNNDVIKRLEILRF